MWMLTTITGVMWMLKPVMIKLTLTPEMWILTPVLWIYTPNAGVMSMLTPEILNLH